VKNTLNSARAYLDRLPPAISGAGGHGATFYAACCLVRLGMSDADSMACLGHYNLRCQPPWTEKELAHKLKDAREKIGGQVRVLTQPRPAARLVWKLERKAASVAERVTTAATRAKPPQAVPSIPSAERVEPDPLAPDQVPWLHIARLVAYGEFDGADNSTVESLTIGLRTISHPLCRKALNRLPDNRQKRNDSGVR
jgi:hypothetical protein